ncbi:MAG: hypothetical protein KDD47_18045, partial [Acidobacteria bacterium]|nr:hypothetical protein [Acidobacteriota bacterium]
MAPPVVRTSAARIPAEAPQVGLQPRPALARTLQIDDPFYAFLRDDVCAAQLGVVLERPSFEVRSLKAPSIFRYRERSTGIDLVAKFYGGKPLFTGVVGDRRLRAGLML